MIKFSCICPLKWTLQYFTLHIQLFHVPVWRQCQSSNMNISRRDKLIHLLFQQKSTFPLIWRNEVLSKVIWCLDFHYLHTTDFFWEIKETLILSFPKEAWQSLNDIKRSQKSYTLQSSWFIRARRKSHPKFLKW